MQQVIEASIACARTAAQETGALVALDIGPIGELLAPAGTLPFEDACASLLRWCAPVPQPGQTSSFWKQ